MTHLLYLPHSTQWKKPSCLFNWSSESFCHSVVLVWDFTSMVICFMVQCLLPTQKPRTIRSDNSWRELAVCTELIWAFIRCLMGCEDSKTHWSSKREDIFWALTRKDIVTFPLTGLLCVKCPWLLIINQSNNYWFRYIYLSIHNLSFQNNDYTFTCQSD